ncbi:MAG: hypothetical protein ABIL44_01050 [candidate division WOR-3 bacterium]
MGFPIKIPLLTASGGILRQPEFALEFRVWVHPVNGDDKAYCFSSLKEAKKRYPLICKDKRWAIVEPIIAVVWDNRIMNFREVLIKTKI